MSTNHDSNVRLSPVDRSAHRIVRDLNGVPLCANDLPSLDKNWTPRRKARLLIAIEGRIITKREAMQRYCLSEEELASWRLLFESNGLDGLKALRSRS